MLQNRHACLQVSPINMTVAIPPPQHSPMFGQHASPHTVDSPRLRTDERSRRYSFSALWSPGVRIFNQNGLDGFCYASVRLLRTDKLAPGEKCRDIGFSFDRRMCSSFKRARDDGAHVDIHRGKLFMADEGENFSWGTSLVQQGLCQIRIIAISPQFDLYSIWEC